MPHIVVLVTVRGERMDNEQLTEAKHIYIGRLFTLGGSVLFLIGSFIAAVVGYQAYEALLTKAKQE